MTNREFYTAIANGTINDEIVAFANASIEKLDARNATRNSKPSKVQMENAPIKQALVEYLTTHNGAFTEGDLGVALGVTHNKAGALARQLVAEGIAQVAEIKIPKVGKRKAYSIVVESDGGEE